MNEPKAPIDVNGDNEVEPTHDDLEADQREEQEDKGISYRRGLLIGSAVEVERCLAVLLHKAVTHRGE